MGRVEGNTYNYPHVVLRDLLFVFGVIAAIAAIMFGMVMIHGEIQRPCREAGGVYVSGKCLQEVKH